MLVSEKVAYPAGEMKSDRFTVETTLFELVEAISDEVSPKEEKLIPEIISHLFATGKAKFIGDLKGCKVEIV